MDSAAVDEAELQALEALASEMLDGSIGGDDLDYDSDVLEASNLSLSAGGETDLQHLLDGLSDDITVDDLEDLDADSSDASEGAELDADSSDARESARAAVGAVCGDLDDDGELSDESRALKAEIESLTSKLKQQSLEQRRRRGTRGASPVKRPLRASDASFVERQRVRAQKREARLALAREARGKEQKTRAMPTLHTRSKKKKKRSGETLYQRGVAQRCRKAEAERRAREVDANAFKPRIATTRGGRAKPGALVVKRPGLYERALEQRRRKLVQQDAAADAAEAAGADAAAKRRARVAAAIVAAAAAGGGGAAGVDSPLRSLYERGVEARRRKEALLTSEKERALGALTFTPKITRKAQRKARGARGGGGGVAAAPVHERLFAAAQEQALRLVVLADQERAHAAASVTGRPDVSASAASFSMRGGHASSVSEGESGDALPVYERLYAEQVSLFYLMHRYISCESCSQFHANPVTCHANPAAEAGCAER